MTSQDDDEGSVDDEDSLACSSLGDTTAHTTTFLSMEERDADGSDKEDPEFVMVRQVTKAVRVSRAVVLFVLIVAAIATAWLVYQYTAQSELEAFEKEFDGVADKIVESLKGESISLKLWMTRTLAASIHLTMKLTQSNAVNVTMPVDEWDSLTGETRMQANAHVVAWSPLLLTTRDREIFEETYKQTEGSVPQIAGTNPICYLCETATAGYSNPDDEVTVVGFGTDKCSRVENLGRTGIIPESMCEFAKEKVNSVCKCTENITQKKQPYQTIRRFQ